MKRSVTTLTVVLAMTVPRFVFSLETELSHEARSRLDAVVSSRVAEQKTTDRRAAKAGLRARVLIDGGRIAMLSRVLDGGAPQYLMTTNLEAARTVATNTVWPGGAAGLALDGTGLALGMWDEGAVRESHRELVNRVTTVDQVGVVRHSTHVAGTLIATGIGPALRGMASQATVRSWNFVNDEAEMATEQMNAVPVRISNHSYVFVSGWQFGSFGLCAGDPQYHWFGDVAINTEEDPRFGLYESSSEAWDAITASSPLYLPVKSAGNDRGQGLEAGEPHCHFDGSAGSGAGDWVHANDPHPLDGEADGGFDSIAGGAGSAKNNLTVGAVHDLNNGYNGPQSVLMSDFSGWGPTDDGRIKPDLVANGVLLTSTDSSGDADYFAMSGTSMAAASVSGSLLLLRQHAEGLGQVLAATALKGLVLHTADEAGAFPGPDYAFGWGLLNTRKAAELLSQNQATGEHLWGATLQDGGSWSLWFWSAGDAEIRATLVWADPPGAPHSGTELDPPTPNLVNDLDVHIEGASGPHLPWVLDPADPAAAATRGDNIRDNVEQIVIAAPPAGHYQLFVGHKGALTNGQQPFSLILSGNLRGGVFADGFETGTTDGWSAAVPSPPFGGL